MQAQPGSGTIERYERKNKMHPSDLSRLAEQRRLGEQPLTKHLVVEVTPAKGVAT